MFKAGRRWWREKCTQINPFQSFSEVDVILRAFTGVASVIKPPNRKGDKGKKQKSFATETKPH
jgi:hypothetical protein